MSYAGEQERCAYDKRIYPFMSWYHRPVNLILTIHLMASEKKNRREEVSSIGSKEWE